MFFFWQDMHVLEQFLSFYFYNFVNGKALHDCDTKLSVRRFFILFFMHLSVGILSACTAIFYVNILNSHSQQLKFVNLILPKKWDNLTNSFSNAGQPAKKAQTRGLYVMHLGVIQQRPSVCVYI